MSFIPCFYNSVLGFQRREFVKSQISKNHFLKAKTEENLDEIQEIPVVNRKGLLPIPIRIPSENLTLEIRNTKNGMASPFDEDLFGNQGQCAHVIQFNAP